MSTLKSLLNPNHPVLGGARILADDEILRADDTTACVSVLLSPLGEEFVPVHMADAKLVGKTVGYALSEEYGDMDRRDRIYVRKEQEMPQHVSDGAPSAVFSYVHHNGRVGALVELSAETDFALRTEVLQALGKQIAMQFAAECGFEGPKRPWLLDPTKSVEQKVAEISILLGEEVMVVSWQTLSTDHRCLKS